MAIVLLATVTSWCGAADGDTDLAIIHPAVENHIKRLTHRDLELTTYTLNRYNGTGSARLYLDNYPITEVTICATETATGMTIQNAATDYHSALINVETDKIQLKQIGGTAEHDWTNYTFAAYATLTAMVDAIDATSWTATLSDTDYSAYPCTLLLPRLGAPASSAVSLLIPGAMIEHHVIRDQGILYRSYGNWPAGRENIITSFKAGYSTIPDDLEMMILEVCREIYDRKQENSAGLKSLTTFDIKKDLLQIFQRDWIKSIIASYRRIII